MGHFPTIQNSVPLLEKIYLYRNNTERCLASTSKWNFQLIERLNSQKIYKKCFMGISSLIKFKGEIIV